MVPSQKRKRIKIGDVFEVKTAKGLCYFQYLLFNERHTWLIKILPGFFDKRPDNISELVAKKEKYFTFFPVQAALSKGFVELVSNEKVPEHAKEFPLMRMSGFPDSTGKVMNWWLCDGKKEWRIGKLTKKEHELSIVEIWPYPVLIERLENEWKPSDEID